jgi:hypothetical protein
MSATIWANNTSSIPPLFLRRNDARRADLPHLIVPSMLRTRADSWPQRQGKRIKTQSARGQSIICLSNNSVGSSKLGPVNASSSLAHRPVAGARVFGRFWTILEGGGRGQDKERGVFETTLTLRERKRTMR